MSNLRNKSWCQFSIILGLQQAIWQRRETLGHLLLESWELPPPRPLKCGNLFINLLLLSGTQLGRFSIHPLVYLRLNHLVNPNPVSKLLPLSFRICGWNDNISRETSQAVQKQMERENANQRSQGLQYPWRILTLVQQRVSMQQKERGKKIWMEERQSNSITREGEGERHTQSRES